MINIFIERIQINFNPILTHKNWNYGLKIQKEHCKKNTRLDRLRNKQVRVGRMRDDANKQNAGTIAKMKQQLTKKKNRRKKYFDLK